MNRASMLAALAVLCPLPAFMNAASAAPGDPAWPDQPRQPPAFVPATDVTDLWLAANEDGWGLNVIHQGSVLFLTFFVYGPDGSPTWYTSSAAQSTSEISAYSGPLYHTRGPWFAATWNPAALVYREVGSVTFRLAAVNQATVTYSIDNFAMSKSLSRYAFRARDLTGAYLGAVAGVGSGACPIGYDESYFIIVPIAITQTAESAFISIGDGHVTIAGDEDLCVYGGAYTQSGRMGSVTGTYSCAWDEGRPTGTFQASELEATASGFTGRLTRLSDFTINGEKCRWEGKIAGVRRGP